MRKFSNIDNQFMMDHGLTLAETYVLEWMLNLPIWADKYIVNKTTVYFASKNKACEDLPMITRKNDTMYRYYKRLEEKGLIRNHKISNKDYIELTELCHGWNSIRRSEVRPDQSGSLSESTSDVRPTNSISNNSELNNSTLFDNEAIQDIPKEVIKYLNQARGKMIKESGKANQKFRSEKRFGFKFTDKNFKLVKARIAEGFVLEDFKSVIDFKVAEWKNGKMRKFIRPETLFGTKFDRYVVEAADGPPSGIGSDNFEFNPQEKVTVK